MKILLKSSDIRALDHSVRKILDESKHCVALPLKTRDGVSRRVIHVSYANEKHIENFMKLILPTNVEIEISAI